MKLTECWMRFACIVANADHDLIANGNRIDRMTVGGNAAALLLTGTIAMSAWSVFFASFMPGYAAIPAGLLVAATIFMLDRAMSGSDWEFSGILGGRRCTLWWAKLALRCGVATVLATSTATGMLLALCSSAIDGRLQAQRAAMNAPVRAEYDERRLEAARRIVGPRQAEVDAINGERDRVQRRMSELQGTIAATGRAASDARIEAARQEAGDLKGYRPGRGPRFQDAMRMEREFVATAASASAELPLLVQRFDHLGRELERKGTELRQAHAELEAAHARIDQQLAADPRWQPERSGPVSRWMVLEELHNSADTGPAVRRFEWLFMTTMLVLELSFLAIKTLFSPASVYTVQLVRRTKEAAAREAHAHRRYLHALRSGSAERDGATPRHAGGQRPSIFVVGTSRGADQARGNANAQGGDA